MKLIKDVRMEVLPYHTNIVISCERGQNKAIERLLQEINIIDPKKDYDISIKPKKQKRSLDANAYLWTLIGKLAKEMCLMKTEVYKEYIKEMDTFTTVPIKEEEISDWVRDWERGHDGWVCIDIGACRNFPGYHNIKCYKGSSTYDSKQMARLLDMVIYDCKEKGIETRPPDEIARMKAMWGDG